MFGSLFCCAVLCVLFSSAIISLGKRELVALHVLTSWCCVPVIVLCLFVTMQVGLYCVIVEFPGLTHLLCESHILLSQLT